MEFIPRILEKIAPIGMMFHRIEKKCAFAWNILKQITNDQPPNNTFPYIYVDKDLYDLAIMKHNLRNLSSDIKLWMKACPNLPELEDMKREHTELKHKIALKKQTIYRRNLELRLKTFKKTAKSKHLLK